VNLWAMRHYPDRKQGQMVPFRRFAPRKERGFRSSPKRQSHVDLLHSESFHFVVGGENRLGRVDEGSKCALQPFELSELHADEGFAADLFRLSTEQSLCHLAS